MAWPKRHRAVVWALVGLPLTALGLEAPLPMVPSSTAAAAVLAAPESAPVPAGRISDARLTAAIEPSLRPSERISDARVTASADSFSAPSEPISESPVRAPAAAEPVEPTPTEDAAAVDASESTPFREASVGALLAPLPKLGPRCDQTQLGGGQPRYQGLSVSKLYDRLFSPGPAMPHLSGHVPQGLTTWRNWDGAGGTLLLLGMYRKGEDSFLVGIDPASRRHVGTVRVRESHLGGIGVIGSWLITQHAAGPSSEQAVRRYSVDKLRAAMWRAAFTGAKPFLGYEGTPQRISAASFMNVAEGSLWIGRYDKAELSRMYRYTVDDAGFLRRAEGPWKVPPRAQGLLVTPDHFLFASSAGGDSGRLRVYRRTAAGKLGLPVGCLWMPSFPQNLTEHAGRLFASFESGAALFDLPTTVNRITHLHAADLTAVLRVADPVAALRTD